MHIPKNGFFFSNTTSFKTSIIPEIDLRPFIQSAKAPTPGRIILSAYSKSFELEVIKILFLELLTNSKAL